MRDTKWNDTNQPPYTLKLNNSYGYQWFHFGTQDLLQARFCNKNRKVFNLKSKTYQSMSEAKLKLKN